MRVNQPLNQSVVEDRLDEPLPGLLFMLVGPAGVGKNSLMPPLMANVPNLRRLPTATTRDPRPGEQEGRDHAFVSREQFDQMVERNELIEHEEVHPGKFYGVIRQLTHDLIGSGAYLIADVDILGARALKGAFPANVVSIFIAPPTESALEARLRNRGNMPEQEIQDRLERASFELSLAAECDYRVVNEDLDRCVADITAIIKSEITKRNATS